MRLARLVHRQVATRLIGLAAVLIVVGAAEAQDAWLYGDAEDSRAAEVQPSAPNQLAVSAGTRPSRRLGTSPAVDGALSAAESQAAETTSIAPTTSGAADFAPADDAPSAGILLSPDH